MKKIIFLSGLLIGLGGTIFFAPHTQTSPEYDASVTKQTPAERIASIIDSDVKIETDRLILRKVHGSLDKEGNVLDSNGNIVFTTDNKIIDGSKGSVRQDAEQIFAYASNPKMAELTAWENHKTIDDSKKFIRKILNGYNNKTSLMLVIENKENNQIIGSCGFREISQQENKAEFCFAVGRKYWGKGYVTEAVKKLAQFGFDNMKLDKIEALSFPKNTGSIKVMTNIGMKYIKTMPYEVKGKEYDIVMYSISKQEYFAQSK